MTQLKIRGSTQILDRSIPAIKLVDNLNLPTSQLADAARFAIKTLSGQLDMATKRIINAGYPLSSSDAATKGYVDSLLGTGGGAGIITSYTNPQAGDILVLSSPSTMIWENMTLQAAFNAQDLILDGGTY